MVQKNILNWVLINHSSERQPLPHEGVPVIIKVGLEYFTGHIVFSGGALFQCILPNENSTDVAIENVEKWAYIEEELGVIEY